MGPWGLTEKQLLGNVKIVILLMLMPGKFSRISNLCDKFRSHLNYATFVYYNYVVLYTPVLLCQYFP